MSIARREKRKRQREAEKALAYLGDLLGEFFTFLDSKPKPSDASVRSKFIHLDKNWKQYCVTSSLTEKASLLFNQEVAQRWESHYVENTTEK